jgi:heme/copper-type cytochrome/quinol oxidase subunit 3
MVWAFAASKVLTFAPHFIVYAAQSFRDTSYASWATNEVWASVTTTAMILLGGMWRVPTTTIRDRKNSSVLRKSNAV